MQALDEIPMVWANGVFGFILLTIEDRPQVRRRIEATLIALLTVLMTILIVVFDQTTQDMFLLCYGSGVVYVIVRSCQLQLRFDSVRPLALLETALAFYLGGFTLWILDRSFCPLVRPLFLHALWHLAAGTGTFQFTVFWIWIRQLVVSGRTPELRGMSPMTNWVEPADVA